MAVSAKRSEKRVMYCFIIGQKEVLMWDNVLMQQWNSSIRNRLSADEFKGSVAQTCDVHSAREAADVEFTAAAADRLLAYYTP